MVYHEQQSKREAELRILHEQIKPHFLYNTLDTIQWMAQEHGADNVVHMVGALTRLFRIGLSRGREMIRVSEEFEHVKSYLTIQKARYGEKFDYSLEVQPEVADWLTLRVMLQPLVENAIYHGIKEQRGKGSVAGLVPLTEPQEWRRHVAGAPFPVARHASSGTAGRGDQRFCPVQCQRAAPPVLRPGVGDHHRQRTRAGDYRNHPPAAQGLRRTHDRIDRR